MTSKQFVIWLKGFTEGVHEFNITPKQWDLLKEKLAEVNDGTPIGVPIRSSSLTSANLSFNKSHCFGVILNSCTPSVNPFNQRTNSLLFIIL